MKNFTLAETTRQIPYNPVLRPYCLSVTACILMQQLDFRFAGNGGAPFYKFLNPQIELADANGNITKAAHHAYIKGDSWVEELSFSAEEFRVAFDKIGIRYNSFSEYKRSANNGDPFRGKYYLSYHDKIQGMTWYHRNDPLVDSLLDKVFSHKSEDSISVNRETRSTEIGKVDLRKSGNPIPKKTTKMTSEMTTKKTTTTPHREINTAVSPPAAESSSSSPATPHKPPPTIPDLPEELDQALGKADSDQNRILIAQLIDQQTASHLLIAEIKRAKDRGKNPADYLNSALKKLIETGKGYVPTGKLKGVLEVQAQKEKAVANNKAAVHEHEARETYWETLSKSEQKRYLDAYCIQTREEYRDEFIILVGGKFLAWDSRPITPSTTNADTHTMIDGIAPIFADKQSLPDDIKPQLPAITYDLAPGLYPLNAFQESRQSAGLGTDAHVPRARSASS